MEYDETIYLSHYLKNFKNLKIIDLGCGNCSRAFEIINTKPYMKVKTLTCVDSGLMEDRIPELGDIKVEYYNGGYKVDISKFKAEYLNEDEYQYLKEINESFDLIIFSQYFHFFKLEVVIDFLHLAVSKLTNQGIIYIAVANEKHNYSRENDKYIFDSSTIQQLETTFNVIRTVKTGSHYYLFLTKKIIRVEL